LSSLQQTKAELPFEQSSISTLRQNRTLPQGRLLTPKPK
jgi:hypothetical protein